MTGRADPLVLPLAGQRVLVTRPRSQAGELVAHLERLGAACLLLPAVAIVPLEDWSAVDERLANLAAYHWLVFTSANGVRALVGRLRETGRDVDALGHLRLAAIGPATAEALRGFGLEPELVPAEFRSESLAAALRERGRGQRILLARADRGRDVLREQLAEVAEVDQVAVYSQVDAVRPDDPALAALRRGEVRYITLTSSNIARALLQALDEAARQRIEGGDVKLVSISPVTSEEVRKLGLPVAGEAVEYTTAGLVAALVKLARPAGD